MSNFKEVSTKTNLIDWLVYSIVAIVLLIPFFGGEYFKHLSASLIVGFLFGMLNRIIRELVLLREQLNKEE
jgi:preprotein translocase subunit SecF